ncbi:MAG TPA: glycosyltransferase family 9 protein, partial [Rhodocyclaceae bacterium]|nr:glycosyltransferase family 9 protein [Rhodocyclaceae bacterium]
AAEARACWQRALAIRPGHVESRINLAFLLLMEGRYAEGWRYHEARCEPRVVDERMTSEVPDLPFPRWQGEPLAGKSLLIWPEQGLGDCIQFVRYAALLKGRGIGQLTLLCDPALAPLVATAAGVDSVITSRADVRSHDHWCFPMSLPLHFGTTIESIPAELPYLHAPPERLERWRGRLPAAGYRVGLVWRGNPGHRNDANRSLPSLATLAPLWSVPGVSFVSLQKGRGEDEARSSPAGRALLPLGQDIGDLADTAAIVAQLDLVITVDTAVAHVAGALGKPCWIMLPRLLVDWRWLLDRDDSPWYPGAVRLFRQLVEGDWGPVVARVAAALARQAGSRGPARS